MLGNIKYVLVLLALSTLGVSCQNRATAYFNMSGVIGNIQFVDDLTANTTTATFNLDTTTWYSWELKEYPVITTDHILPGQQCSEAALGRTIAVLSGFRNVIDANMAAGTTTRLTGMSLTEGINPMLGRSLLLKSNRQSVEQRACATIQGSEVVSFAVVNGHVAGDIHVRQVGLKFALFTNLFTTNTLQAKRATLRVYKGQISADQPDAFPPAPEFNNRCGSTHFATATLLVELENIPIAAVGGVSKYMQIITANDPRFDFTSGWLKITVDNDDSCANFHKFESKLVTARFSRQGVKGVITFKQDDPYKPTDIQVNLQNLQSQAGGYHVHLYPVPYQYTANTDLCGSIITGGHFNPFNSTTYVGRTQEVFEIGDISSKFGLLQDKENITATYRDMFMPLFGKYSIVGRSIVIHSRSGARWLCANIGYPGPVVVAQADFNGDAQGKITFIQEENKPWTDTTVFVKVGDAGPTSETTSQHKYHIHTNPVGNDYNTEAGRCSSTGGHWNPYDVAVNDDTIYGPTCSANRLGCEVGDLSSKYNELLELSPNPKSYFYSDQIPLSGAYSVIRKSITIHQNNKQAARYVCADIKRKLSPVITTEQWQGPTETETVTGSIVLAPGDASQVTYVDVNLDGLAQKAGGYHIHQLPLNMAQPGSNICGTTGGHYNPLGATLFTPNESFDKYEIGDLSSKFGSLSSRNSYTLKDMDTNLPLTGANSVAGRSVVIHDSTSGRWKCANTVWDVEGMDGVLIQARANFEGEIQGYMTFSQVVSVEGESDVNMEVKLWYRDPQRVASLNHNWHVHVYSLDQGVCTSAAGHYNPFDVNVGASDYGVLCSVSSPTFCEVGDMAGKLGKINIGTKEEPTRYVFNDGFLSLTGKFSVMGRSIVIHAEESGAPRVACADIAPFGPSTQMVEYFIRTPQGNFKNFMADDIAKRMNIDMNSQHVYVNVKEHRGDCALVNVYLTGENATYLRSRFDMYNTANYQAVSADTCGSVTITAFTGFVILSTLAKFML